MPNLTNTQFSLYIIWRRSTNSISVEEERLFNETWHTTFVYANEGNTMDLGFVLPKFLTLTPSTTITVPRKNKEGRTCS